MAASKPVAPLALSAVKLRYPRLFRKYTILSDREKECMADIGDDHHAGEPAFDPATGLCTTISFTNFAKPLEDNGDCPMTADSDANKFCIFLCQLLDACEFGSVGDDARRQFDVLNRALDDIEQQPAMKNSVAAKFEHLLGWTAAAAQNGLHALIYQGDPDHNRSLFKAVGDEWKKVFENTANNSSETGVSEELRKFAIYMCETFQTLLQQANKEYGEHAKYNFNFIKKPCVQKEPVATMAVTKNTLVTAATAKKSVTIVVTKPSKDVKLGLGIAQEKGAKTITISSIPPNSLFVGTDLKVGMLLITINGMKYTSFAEGFALLKAAEGRVTIVAAPPVSADNPADAPSSPAATTNGGSNQKENSVPVKNSGSEADDEPKPLDSDESVSMSGEKQRLPT